MQRALDLASNGKGSAPPNPWVGCVIVHQNKTIIGEGYHRRAGEDHAEVAAIKDAIQKGNEKLLKGSTLYVTLEPCHHTGRTPPCDQLIVKHGIKKVVIGCLDPDPRVNSAGIDYLRQQGIEVEICMEEEAQRLLAPYLHHRKTGLPYCIIKAALSIDGCIATEHGDSKWLSNRDSRGEVQKWRSESQAIIVGANTVIKDNPRLNVRDFTVEKQPLRVIFDARGRVTKDQLQVMDTKTSKTLIFTSSASDETKKIWEKQGVDYQIVSEISSGQLNIIEALQYLGSKGILQCLIEGGAGLYTSFLNAGVVNEACFYHANLNLGLTGKKWIALKESPLIKDIERWKLIETKQVGESDVFTRYLIPPGERGNDAQKFDPIAECELAIKNYGEWTLKCYESGLSMPHRALIKNLKNASEPVLVRVHSDCYTGDTLGSLLCDCREQLELSMAKIAEKGSGVIILPAGHEGRGIGLVNKVRAYHLIKESEGKIDTYEANRQLGFEDDLRDYSMVPLILDNLGIKQIEILTNNVQKIQELKRYIVKITPLIVVPNPLNEKYMKVKSEKYGYTEVNSKNGIWGTCDR